MTKIAKELLEDVTSSLNKKARKLEMDKRIIDALDLESLADIVKHAIKLDETPTNKRRTKR